MKFQPAELIFDFNKNTQFDCLFLSAQICPLGPLKIAVCGLALFHMYILNNTHIVLVHILIDLDGAE